MSTPELRKKIIAKVMATRSERLLLEIDHMIRAHAAVRPVQKMTPAQKKAVAKSREDYKKGRYLTAEQADKEILAWLRE